MVVALLVGYSEINLNKLPNSYKTKRSNFENQIGSIQILVLGSSDALYGINPAYFRFKGFNLAQESQSIFYDKELVLKYVDQIPNLKTVLISVSYFSLFYQLYDAVENWRDEYYTKFWDISSNSPQHSLLPEFSLIALYGTSFSQNAFRKNFRVIVDFVPFMNGWYNPTASIIDRESILEMSVVNDSSAKALIDIQNLHLKNEYLLQNESYLNQLILQLSNRKINFVVISTPVYNTYSKYFDLERERLMIECIDRICKKHNCKYFSYLRDSRFIKEDFNDNNHLNSIGSEKFSKILNDDIFE